MMYLLAIVLPPVAVLFCGKPFSAILNFLLTCCFWVPGIIHAMAVIGQTHNDKRNDKLIKAINNNSQQGQKISM